MIGGCDVVFPTQSGILALEAVTRAILAFWPEAVFEDAETDGVPCHFNELELSAVREIFAYRDAQVADEWDRKGAVPELANTMVHLLASSTSLTVVVCERNNPEMAAYLEDVKAKVDECEKVGRDSKP